MPAKIHALSASEIIAARLHRTPLARAGKSEFLIQTNRGGGYEYPIERSRLKDEKDLLAWLEHLMEKNWFTTEHGLSLIAVARQENNLRRYMP